MPDLHVFSPYQSRIRFNFIFITGFSPPHNCLCFSFFSFLSLCLISLSPSIQLSFSSPFLVESVDEGMSECGLCALSSVLEWNKSVVLAVSKNEMIQNAPSLLRSSSTSSLTWLLFCVFSWFVMVLLCEMRKK
jgi:hypothetical protein